MLTQTARAVVPTPSALATNSAVTIPSQTSLLLPDMPASLPQPVLQHSLIPSTQPWQLQAEITQNGHCQSAMGPPAMAQPGPQMGFAQPGNILPEMPIQRFQQPMGQPGYTLPWYSQPGMPQPTQHRQTVNLMTVNNTMYRVLSLLGQGGFSKVYEALDGANNLRAIKCVNLVCAHINSYENEIELLKQLQYSSKIIKLYDYEFRKDCKMLYIVMERGEADLASLFLKWKGKVIDIIWQKFYWKEMLEAVQVLHMAGIVHSDLKPANFVLVAGELKLIEFGIAQAIHQDMTSVTVDQQVGTPDYMSPEAIDYGHIKPKIKIGLKSDVWSLGCILYNLVYRYTPFHNIPNKFSKLFAITNPMFGIDFPIESADPILRKVLMQCLQRDPQVRPSIEELLSYQY